jgi:hypothetical protein
MLIFFYTLFSLLNFNLIEHKENLKVNYSNNHSTEWKIEYIDSEIKIESAALIIDDKANGIKHERIVFKYSNLSSKKITISFSRKLYYNGKCIGCENSLDKKISVSLNPLESKSYDDLNNDKTYYIFSKDLNKTITKILDSFQLTPIEKTY